MTKITAITITTVILFSSIFLAGAQALAMEISLQWDQTSPIPDGYRVYVRTTDQNYSYNSPDWQGSGNTCTIDNLNEMEDYCFVVRAYESSAVSEDSNEVCHYSSETNTSSGDSQPPSWNCSTCATNGIGLAKDTTLGGQITVEFDKAIDNEDGSNLKFNVYYARSSSWNNNNWNSNSFISDADTHSGNTFSHAVTISGLTNNVKYTFGVRAEDQSGNEETNTRTLTVTPTKMETAGSYNLMLSYSPSRSNQVLLADNTVDNNIYVFVDPVTDIKTVEFYIDGKLEQAEGRAPYDLAGGSATSANPFDASGLTSGYHAFSAKVTKTNGVIETIDADVHVYNDDGTNTSSPSNSGTSSNSTYNQLFSKYSNRSNPDLLDGATVNGQIYVFVEPTTNINNVQFYIDGKLEHSERGAPYDLAGGAVSSANSFDASGLTSGNHTFSAKVTKTNGVIETIDADVHVYNDDGTNTSSPSNSGTSSNSTYNQLFSKYSNRSNPNHLDGATVSGQVYVFVEPITAVSKVEFYIDGKLEHSERSAPYDLAGGSVSSANSFDAGGLTSGYHTFRAKVTKTSGAIETINADVYVSN